MLLSFPVFFVGVLDFFLLHVARPPNRSVTTITIVHQFCLVIISHFTYCALEKLPFYDTGYIQTFCAVTVHHIVLFCAVTPCSPVGGYRYVRDTHCLRNWCIRKGGEVFCIRKVGNSKYYQQRNWKMSLNETIRDCAYGIRMLASVHNAPGV